MGENIWGSANDGARKIIQSQDGGYAIVGFTDSNDGDVTGYHKNSVVGLDFDIWLLKLDSAGDLMWQKTLGGSSDDDGNSILQTPNGNFLLVGDTYSSDGDVQFHHPDSNRADAWLVEVSNAGSILWSKILGGPLIDNSADGIVSADGGYIIGGSSLTGDGDSIISTGGLNYWLYKLAPDTTQTILTSIAIDSSFLPKSWDALSHEYTFRAIGGDVIIDSLILSSTQPSRFSLSHGFREPYLVKKGEIISVRVDYDPFTLGTNTTRLIIGSKQVNYIKSIELVGSAPVKERPTLRVALSDSLDNGSLAVLPGQNFRIQLTLLDSIPQNVVIHDLHIKLGYKNDIVKFEKASPSSDWILQQSQSDGHSTDIFLSHTTNSLVAQGASLAQLFFSSFLSDSQHTEISIDSLIINNNDISTARRLQPNISVSPLSVTVNNYCDDSTIISLLHLHQLIQKFDAFTVVANDGSLESMVNFKLSKPSHVKIFIYSSLGSYLGCLFAENIDSEHYQMMLPTSSFPGGQYFLKLQAADEERVRPILLLK